MFEQIDKLINDSGLAGFVSVSALFLTILIISLIKKTKTYQKFLNHSVKRS
jgi:hypothetical protein